LWPITDRIYASGSLLLHVSMLVLKHCSKYKLLRYCLIPTILLWVL